MIDKNRTYKTRDGREVRIYATDGGFRSEVHGAYLSIDNEWHVASWNKDGAWATLGDELDLIEVRPRIKRTVWVIIYPDNDGTVASVFGYSNQTEALRRSYKNRLACVRVEIDVEEGEGL